MKYKAFMYNKDNVFFKIINKEISANIIYENDTVIAFNDINPKSKIHILVITKNLYTDFSDFVQNATDQEIQKFNRSINKVIQKLKLDKTGYRLISNMGSDAKQEVPHFHVHILGGEPLNIM